jgi:hypothetical protein
MVKDEEMLLKICDTSCNEKKLQTVFQGTLNSIFRMTLLTNDPLVPQYFIKC